MLIAFMVYLTTVTFVVAGAAWLVERLAVARGRPSRWGWALAVTAPVALGALALWGPPGGAGEILLGPLTVEAVAPPTEVAVRSPTSLLLAAERLAGPVWVALSGTWLLVFGVSALRLARARRRWRPTRIAGHRVRISHDTGPAVVGVFAPEIVLPSWVLDAPEGDRRWIVRHEVAHVRAGDSRLVLGAFAVAVAFPWNPGLWWAFRRLRDAVEVDCDRRVLARASRLDRRHYGELLLRVARHLRSDAPRYALAAFAERGTVLERRIRTMLGFLPNLSIPSRLALGGGAALLIGLACVVPGPDRAGPTGPELDDIEEPVTSQVAPAAPDDGPAFTPFTVAPEIVNRAEVQEALLAEYPPLLRDAGIGGTALLWFYIDEAGAVTDVRVNRSSGSPPLDQAALRVAERMRFSPALNRDERVAVWVSFPITFQVQ